METPNIIMIVMDAVRACNMSIYGYQKETTPMLRRLLPRSVLYKNAISSSYWTLPSYASTFTGTHVSKHRLVVDGDILNEKFVTMAEFLRACGYKTIALCPNPFVSGFSGLHRGFEVFRNPADASLRFKLYSRFNKAALQLRRESTEKVVEKDFGGRWLFHDVELQTFRESNVYKKALWMFKGFFDKYAKTTNNLAFKLIEKIRGKPFFAFIHYHETHSPYVLPRSFRGRFMPSDSKKPWNVNQDHFKYYSGEATMGEVDFSILKALYDGAISYLDAKVFEFYSFLEKEELLENTMIIIVSDHGDSIGENDIFFHVFGLYDTLIKIPLIIKYPADFTRSGTESRIVQNTDLLPTIMDVLQVNDKKLLNQIQGNSLVSSDIANRDYSYAVSELLKPFGPRMRSIKGRLEKYNRQLISIRTEDNKYIYASDGNHEFYDLRNDPNETNNLVGSQDFDTNAWNERLNPWLDSFKDGCRDIQARIKEGFREAEFNTEIQQRLKSLGYL